MKTITLISLATLSSLTVFNARASAEPAMVTLGGGLGSAVAVGEECPGGQTGFFCSGRTLHRLEAPAPYLVLGYIKRTPQRRGWAFRFGPEIIATAIDGRNARAYVAGAAMNVGFHFYRLFGQGGLGLSKTKFRGGDFRAQGTTVFLHSGVGVHLDRQWAIFGRAELHASGTFTVTNAGLGVTYTPGR